MASLKPSPSFTLTLALTASMLMLGLGHTWTEPLLEFNRTLIEQGQWWRLVTGQWVHYGVYHLAMNLLAFLLCGFILLRDLALRHYATLLLTCLLGVAGGLYWASPELHYYAGLSGAVHGLLVAGLLLHLRSAPWLHALALLVLAGKIVQEQSAGFDPTHPLLPVPVAVDAHLYGTLAGILWGLGALALRRWQRARKGHSGDTP